MEHRDPQLGGNTGHPPRLKMQKYVDRLLQPRYLNTFDDYITYVRLMGEFLSVRNLDLAYQNSILDSFSRIISESSLSQDESNRCLTSLLYSSKNPEVQLRIITSPPLPNGMVNETFIGSLIGFTYDFEHYEEGSEVEKEVIFEALSYLAEVEFGLDSYDEYDRPFYNEEGEEIPF